MPDREEIPDALTDAPQAAAMQPQEETEVERTSTEDLSVQGGE